MKDRIICRVLTGPTASGKSEYAMRLAAENGWDILCMDSMQVYRRMNIGTAKPTAEDRRKVPHHLIDLCEPDEPFSVSRYIEEAERTIQSLHEQGKGFLLVGGTGLYLEGLMKPMGLGFTEENAALRKELHLLADLPDGRRLLDERLRRCDPATADKLPLNDIRRRIRAIEVSETTGVPFSQQPARYSVSPYIWRAVCIVPDRDILYTRIKARVMEMIEKGLPDEVAALLNEGIPENAQSLQAIGYKEMIPYLHGEYDLSAAADMIQKATRHYAKRQMTFLKRIDNLFTADPLEKGFYNQISNILKGTGNAE